MRQRGKSIVKTNVNISEGYDRWVKLNGMGGIYSLFHLPLKLSGMAGKDSLNDLPLPSHCHYLYFGVTEFQSDMKAGKLFGSGLCMLLSMTRKTMTRHPFLSAFILPGHSFISLCILEWKVHRKIL